MPDVYQNADPAEPDSLGRVRQLSKVIAARVSEVVAGDIPSFFLNGPGGHGKSHAVLGELNKKPGRGKWRHWNSRMTSRALVEQLASSPNHIHLFEDMEDLYRDKTSASILRSACASVKGGSRRVTYTTARDEFDFEFKGGVIVISNAPLSGNGVLGALASRMRPLAWRLRPEEIMALIRDIAAKGHTHRGHVMPPNECQEVAEFVIGQMHENPSKVDLRTYCDHALPSYWHWKHARTLGVHWTAVVKSKILGEPVVEQRQERVERERAIACQCFKDGNNTQNRVELWRQRTPWRMQAFYNRLKEAKATGMFAEIVGNASQTAPSGQLT